MEVTEALATEAGLFGLWSPASFPPTTDWEGELLDDEDVMRHIAAGAFVPINIGADGAFQFVARVGSVAAPAGLSGRERRYAAVVSDAYRFVAPDHDAVISGIEHVGTETGLRVPLPDCAHWRVRVALVDWAAEPGQQRADGGPGPDALPDFVVLLNPEAGEPAYRVRIETFDASG
ncbi:hypothetical protein O7635_13135 [Asanoa sp. WMMD1127]|uniref:hypothetical protein n=1 Tax=Asanoa sp. WMMD1127 TaxID=3016107 RepID=UPI002416FEC6|nr:hypothetical protein [Asanoa sp. WMMD1127]MDG4822793.1 hypothetical protein [Asanoa sp. WMMD1127]